jgi:hypothetical protein
MFYLTGLTPMSYGGQQTPIAGDIALNTNDHERSVEETLNFDHGALPIYRNNYSMQMPSISVKWSRLCTSDADASSAARNIKAKIAMGGQWLKGILLDRSVPVQQRFFPSSLSINLRSGKKYKILDVEMRGVKYPHWLHQSTSVINPAVVNAGGYGVANLAAGLGAAGAVIEGLSFDFLIGIAVNGNLTNLEFYNALPYGTQYYNYVNTIPSAGSINGVNTADYLRCMVRFNNGTFNYNNSYIYGMNQSFLLSGYTYNNEINGVRYVDTANNFYPVAPFFFLSPASLASFSVLTVPYVAGTIGLDYRQVYA